MPIFKNYEKTIDGYIQAVKKRLFSNHLSARCWRLLKNKGVGEEDWRIRNESILGTIEDTIQSNRWVAARYTIEFYRFR